MPKSRSRRQLNTNLATPQGTPPDVSWVATGGFQALSFAKQGGLLPLDDYIDTSFKDQIPDFFDFLWKANNWQGKTWGIPYDTYNPAWFYNEDLLKADGITPSTGNPTWDEMTQMFQTATKNGKFGYQVSDAGIWFFTFLKQAGGELVNGDVTKCTVNSPEGEATLQWYSDLVWKYKVSPNPPLKNGFENGNVAFEFQGSYRIPVYRQLTGIKVSAMHTSKNRVPFASNGGESLVLWKTNSTRQDAAWKFVRGMTTKDNILEWDVKSGYLPVRKSVLDDDAYKKILKDDPIRQVFVDELNYGGFWINTPYGADVLTTLQNNLDRVLLKNESVKTVLADMQTQIDNVLAGKQQTG
jgi:ABC-type glycerol-3-phosphate transport system substrate-binding protein